MFTSLSSGIHNLAAMFAGAGPDRCAIFLKKINTLQEKGRIFDGFYIEQKKTKEGDIIVLLRIPNTPENFALIDSNQLACTNVAFRDYNPLYNDFIFDIDTNFYPSGDLSYIYRQIHITKNKYTG